MIGQFMNSMGPMPPLDFSQQQMPGGGLMGMLQNPEFAKMMGQMQQKGQQQKPPMIPPPEIPPAFNPSVMQMAMQMMQQSQPQLGAGVQRFMPPWRR